MSSDRRCRCPNCGRLFGVARTPLEHTGCTAVLEVKCGRCGQLVIVPLDPDIHPYIQSN